MFPQSGERFEGLENFREWRRIYPATKAEFDIRRVRGHDDVWEPPRVAVPVVGRASSPAVRGVGIRVRTTALHTCEVRGAAAAPARHWAHGRGRRRFR
jgi:hypothetical protein